MSNQLTWLSLLAQSNRLSLWGASPLQTSLRSETHTRSHYKKSCEDMCRGVTFLDGVKTPPSYREQTKSTWATTLSKQDFKKSNLQLTKFKGNLAVNWAKGPFHQVNLARLLIGIPLFQMSPVGFFSNEHVNKKWPVTGLTVRLVCLGCVQI